MWGGSEELHQKLECKLKMEILLCVLTTEPGSPLSPRVPLLPGAPWEGERTNFYKTWIKCLRFQKHLEGKRLLEEQKLPPRRHKRSETDLNLTLIWFHIIRETGSMSDLTGLGLVPTTGPWGPGSPEAAEVQEQAFGRAGHFNSSLWKRRKITLIKTIRRRCEKPDHEEEKVIWKK